MTITTGNKTEVSAHDCALLMKRLGGSFAKAMGEALLRADVENTRRIVEAFPELMRVYAEMFVANPK